MTPQEIEITFSLATRRELEANAFYARVAKNALNPEVKQVFEQLANEEMGHFELLERFRTDPTLPLKMTAPPQNYRLAEATPLPPFSDDMLPRDAIALAMKKEQEAVEFYLALSAGTPDAGLKDIFDNLANMELVHKQRLENVFVAEGYPEIF
ncbi:MAG: hypothetical protein ACD_62C00666G0004 [uncultured bacterium]|nr:MAG: hypothetical protein ACD_62C00666G0004 [uncultured bacterium]HLD45967.1 ferritin family protein [bacterium]